jgi:zinc and cadmium transporter
MSAILAITLTFAASFTGFALARKTLPQKLLQILIWVGAGAMTSISLTHILPEAAEASEYAGIAFFVGFCAIFLLDYLHCTHPHAWHEEAHDHTESSHTHEHKRSLLGFSGLYLHTAFDGVAIVSAFTLSAITGWIVTLAVIVHQIPVSLALAGIAQSSRFTRREVQSLFGYFGLSIVVGAAIIGFIPLGWLEPLILALSGWSLLYIGASDLLPELRSHSQAGVRVIGSFLVGGLIPIVTYLVAH